jgi:hypothetical protein
LWFLGIFYLIFRRYQSKKREKHIAIVRFIQMYSDTSLTVYFFEPLTSALLFQAVQNIYWIQPISENFFVWFPFLIINAVVWWLILYFWRGSEYTGSIEWCLAQVRRLFKKKDLNFFDSHS